MNIQQLNNLVRRYLLDAFEGMAGIEEMYVGRGNTIENDAGNVRIQRYNSSFEVTDLTNAGKRGKKVKHFSLYDTDRVRDNTVDSNLEKFAGGVHKVKNYDQALKWAQVIVKDAEQRKKGAEFKGLIPKMEEGESRGVDVIPGGKGFAKITFKNSHITGRVAFDDFAFRDYNDPNEMSIIDTQRTGKRGLKRFYDWAKKNEAKLKKMNLNQVGNALDKLKVQYHMYAAMD